jgi:hypothetical protein
MRHPVKVPSAAGSCSYSECPDIRLGGRSQLDLTTQRLQRVGKQQAGHVKFQRTSAWQVGREQGTLRRHWSAMARSALRSTFQSPKRGSPDAPSDRLGPIRANSWGARLKGDRRIRTCSPRGYQKRGSRRPNGQRQLSQTDEPLGQAGYRAVGKFPSR